MSAFDAWEMRLAWQIARQMRGCPPDRHVLAERPAPELLAHLEICAFCRDLHRSGAAAAEEFELARRLPLPREVGSVPPVAGGQVWSLLETLAGWGPRKRYYNPPLVLILAEATGLGDAMRVSQVYDDARLMGPGDVPLGEGLFAEAWNTYTLRRCYLDRLMATGSEEILKAMRDREAKEEPPLDEHSHLKAFRRLELEVGAFFATRAVAELMGGREPDLMESLGEAFPEDRTVLDRIRRSNPGITWPDEARPLIEALVLARFPDDAVPLAASSQQKIVPVNILTLHAESSGVSFSPGLAVISVWREHQDGLLVGGRVEETLGQEVELSARLELPEGELRPPAEAFLDAASGHFRAFFPTVEAARVAESRLHLLVLTR